MPLSALASLQDSIEKLASHAMIIHSDDISHPSHLSSDNQGLNTGGLRMIQDLQFGGTLWPKNAKDETERVQVKFLII